MLEMARMAAPCLGLRSTLLIQDNKNVSIKMNTRLISIAIVLVVTGCRPDAHERQSTPTWNSFFAIAASPEKYDKRQVTVIGYMSLNCENTALFLHEEDYRRTIFSNAIWLHMSAEQKRVYQRFTGQYCLVEGVFRSADYGFGGFYAGAMDVINVEDYIDATNANRAGSSR